MADEEGEGQQAGAQEAVVETPAVAPEVETKARETGWVPKDEYRGDPAKWRPADKWVERGEQGAAENKRLKERITRLEQDSADKIANLERMSAAALKAQRAQIESQYETVKEKAVELGDTKQYKAADKAQKDALKEFDDAATEKPAEKEADGPPGWSKEDRETLRAWNAANPWFNSKDNRKLTGAADDAWWAVEREMPGASLADKLAEIKARVAEEFPIAFGKKSGNGASRVEGAGGRGPSGDDGGEAWAKLPADVKNVAKNHIEQERLYDPPGKKKSEKLTPAELRDARERWAAQFNS